MTSRVDIVRMRMRKVNFRKVNFRKVNFRKVNFRKVNFRKVNFRKVNFRKVNFRKVNFRKVNFRKVNFRKVNFRKVNFRKEWLKRGVSRLPAFVLGLMQTYEMVECDSVFYWVLGIWFSILTSCASGVPVMRVVDIDIALVYGVYLLFNVHTMVDDSSLTKVDPISKDALSVLVHPEAINMLQSHLRMCLVPPGQRDKKQCDAAKDAVGDALISAQKELQTLSGSSHLTETEKQLVQATVSFLITTIRDVSRWV
ncbi:hypothetical protein TSOC_012340 [Tetrabaena socialis]|uniref:Uncharacterized protein n=1 Tax=Tetrabaena socialis TaxID=47790 RepID=A0A2J7ZNA0_9CHLO|nr:hypothetical protein TSOC_012340 [Tetrabaena socialis]|eukprot:PNH01749.1 hypothetical protein TSOC_012340 [Tetrabaena socialis]